jgi:osmoprotectant transport system permease protein
VGAPSLGNLIFAGLQTRRHGSVLLGCLGAAALALTLDGLLRLAERGARERRSRWVVAPLVAVAAIGLAATAPALIGGGAEPVRIGAKTFTEQYVLAAILEDLAEGAGEEAEVVSSLGSTVAFDALTDGAIDLYVDYSGTLWTTVMERSTEGVSRREVLGGVSSWLEETHGVELVCELGFENTYALVMRGEDTLGAIDALAARSPELTVGGDYELFERPEWEALEATYGLRFRDERTMDPSLMYEALDRGDVDVIGAYSTDGRIAARDLAVLADPAGVIPPYDAVLLARPGLSRAKPELLAALRERICGAVDADRMRELNRLVDEDGRSPGAAAASFTSR